MSFNTGGSLFIYLQPREQRPASWEQRTGYEEPIHADVAPTDPESNFSQGDSLHRITIRTYLQHELHTRVDVRALGELPHA